MDIIISKLVGLSTGIVVFLLIVSCIDVYVNDEYIDDVHNDSFSVELDGAKSVNASFAMRAGQFKISGGTRKLLEGDARYDDPRLEPRVVYNVNNGQGDLKVNQDRTISDINEWNLRLNEDVLMNLSVRLGMSEGDLDLRQLSLNKLDLKLGVSDANVNLTGDWKRDIEVRIIGGVCSTTLRIPDNIGVRIKVRGILNTVNANGLEKNGNVYVNDALGKSKRTLYVYSMTAVGEINLIVDHRVTGI